MNIIWVPQPLLTNYFAPQQKLSSVIRNGANVIKKYDRPMSFLLAFAYLLVTSARDVVDNRLSSA